MAEGKKRYRVVLGLSCTEETDEPGTYLSFGQFGAVYERNDYGDMVAIQAVVNAHKEKLQEALNPILDALTEAGVQQATKDGFDLSGILRSETERERGKRKD